MVDPAAVEEVKEQPIREAYVCPPPKSRAFGPDITADNFELKPSLIQLVQQHQFGGDINDDPHRHLSNFVMICDTVRMMDVSDDIIRLRLFPFSLRGEAKSSWLDSLEPETISTWNEMCKRFMLEFFPMRMVMRVIREITNFKQMNGEPLHEAWERFKGLMRKCPEQGLSKGYQVCYFYHGLNRERKMMVDASCGGSFMGKTVEGAMRVLEEMASNSYQWYDDEGRSSQVINEPKKPSVEEMCASFMEESRGRCDRVETRMDGILENMVRLIESLDAKLCSIESNI